MYIIEIRDEKAKVVTILQCNTQVTRDIIVRIATDEGKTVIVTTK